MKTAAERLDEQWDRSFAEFQAWVTRTGGLPRRRSNEATEYRLANWLNRQRTDSRKGTIDPEHERRLRTIPGALEASGLRLSDVVLADRVGSFHATHGRLPRRGVKGEGTTVNYLARLRAMTRVGDISAEALSAFETIPGAVLGTSSKQSPTVDGRLEHLRRYLAENGHLPPYDAPLGQWLNRALRGKASTRVDKAERARKAANALIEGHQTRAELHRREETSIEGQPTPPTGRKPKASRYVPQLEEYVALHGHLPSSGAKSEPRYLRRHLLKLLANPRISESQAERINALLEAPTWSEGNTVSADRIAQFYAANGRLPRRGAATPESSLAAQMIRLRARASDGRLSAAARKVLSAVPGALG